jgi:aspartate--ammonia ligase
MKYQDILKTESAIAFVKSTFAQALAQQLQLLPVSAPIAVLDGTGINDDLNGVERPVSFPVRSLGERKAVVVHSLAKWKRLRLQQLGIATGQGILTDMRALRPDEDYTALHSIYVDQWDWEQRMEPAQRTFAFLRETVTKIYTALRTTEQAVAQLDPTITPILPETITFIHAEELLQRYPTLTPLERETEAARMYGAIFIIGIGGKLSHGEPHDGRAPDYDDWSSTAETGLAGLNGDIVLWHPVLGRAFEISSMGIRVDKAALERQLAERGCPERREFQFHQLLLTGQLPQSVGGGIGQSRVCMFMLRRRHIGEVQVSIWPEEERARLAADGVTLL